MAIALVTASEASKNASSVSSTTLAFAGTGNTAGNLLVCIFDIRISGVTISSLTDSAGNTWQQAHRSSVQGGNRVVDIWYAMNCGSGANTITVNFSASTTCLITLHEFSGAALTSALDQANSQVEATTTTHAAPSVTTTSAGVAVGTTLTDGTSVTFTNGTGYSSLKEQDTARQNNEYKTVTNGEAVTAPCTSNVTTIAIAAVVTFKEPAAGGGAVLIHPGMTGRMQEFRGGMRA